MPSSIQSLGIPISFELSNPPLDPSPGALDALSEFPLVVHPSRNRGRDGKIQQNSPTEGREEATPSSSICEADGVFLFVRYRWGQSVVRGRAERGEGAPRKRKMGVRAVDRLLRLLRLLLLDESGRDEGSSLSIELM